jgi:hypothetical protein
VNKAISEKTTINSVRTCFPSWDNDGRRQGASSVVHNSSPALFRDWLQHLTYEAINNKQLLKMVCINAWNEWGEGAFLEPDFDSGFSKLNCVRMAKNIFTARYSKGNKYPDSDSSSLKYDFFESYKHGEFL